MKAYVCPFDYQICGIDKQVIELEKDGTPSVVKTKSGFKADKICNYQIKAPSDATEGDLIYFKIDRIAGVSKPYASISRDLTSND